MNPDYLEALRERYGPDAATRVPDYPPCGPVCLCAGADPCVSLEYDPADDPRPTETIRPRGEYL